MDHVAERADARANRARLIEAAHAVFRERGLDAEMKEIAERAGVGIGTIYRNFPSKDDLIVAIVSEMISHIQTTNDAAERIVDPIEALRAVLHGGFAIAEQYGDLMTALHGSLPRACAEQFHQLDGLRHLIMIVTHGIESGVFRPHIDVEVAAARIAATFVPWHHLRLRASRTVDQLVEAHLDLLLHGMCDRATTE